MVSLNRVLLMGNLGQDPEIRYTSSQTAVATLRIATTERWTGKDGQAQESTEWHRIVVWGKQAENVAKYLTKGKPVFVEGRLQTRSWEDKQGQKRYTTEINASSVQFLPGASHIPQGANNNADMGMGNDMHFSSSGSMSGGFDLGASFPRADPMSASISSGGPRDLNDIPFAKVPKNLP